MGKNDRTMPLPYKGTEPYVFISYSHRDGDEVLEAIRKLQEAGFRVWYDGGIDPGAEWDQHIADHVSECGYFVAFISENYINSSNCKDELSFARDLNKPRFLVYLRETTLPTGLSMRLNRLQAIHKYVYTNEDEFYEKFFDASGIDVCRGEIPLQPEKKEETPVPEPAPVHEEAAPVKEAEPVTERESVQEEVSIREPEPVQETNPVPAQEETPAEEITPALQEKKPALSSKLKALIISACACAAAVIIGCCVFAFSAKAPDEIEIRGAKFSADITELDLSGRNLTDDDIADLRYLKDLKKLNLNDNKLSDLSCLKGLKEMEILSFDNNNVESIDFMKSMKKIQSVHADNNTISDISALKGKKDLRTVFFNSNQITDISPLKNCSKLEWVGFNECKIASIEALRGKTELKRVYAENCGLKTIEPLSDCKNLEYVYIGYNYLTSLAPLSGCTLEKLYVDNNALGGHTDTFSGITVNKILSVKDNGLSIDDYEQIINLVEGKYTFKH